MMVDWSLFFPSGTRVLALPSWQRPRLYLPAQRLVERWEVSSFYPASRYRARLYRLLLRIRAAAGWGGRHATRSGGWPLGEFVQDVLPQTVSAAALVGTPSPAQKVTVQLRDKEGEVLGYLKHAEKEAAHSRLRQEYSMLSAIPRRLGPEALKYGTMGNGGALLIAPILGRRLSTILPPPESVIEFAMSFPASSSAPVEAHPWVRSVRERRSEATELDACFEVLTGRYWPVVVQHGDFAPWNLLQRTDGAIVAFDWEYGTLEGFPYIDIAHYVLETAALVYRWEPAKAARYAVRYLSKEPRFALSTTEARALTRLAAYHAYQKYRKDGQTPDSSWQMWRRVVWETTAWNV